MPKFALCSTVGINLLNIIRKSKFMDSNLLQLDTLIAVLSQVAVAWRATGLPLAHWPKRIIRKIRRFLGPQQLTDANNADWLRRAILNIFLLSPQPSCPNPHSVTKSLRWSQWQNHVTKSLLRGQFGRGQLTWLDVFCTMLLRQFFAVI